MANLSRRGKRWRVTWWTAGRGSKRAVLSFRSKDEAEVRKAEIEAEQAAAKPLRPRIVLDWAELLTRYCRGKGHTESRHGADVVALLTKWGEAKGWRSCVAVTPATTENLPPLVGRYLRAVLRYARQLDQPVDARVLDSTKVRRVRKAEAPLLTDDEVAAILAKARAVDRRGGVLVHLISTYGHRAESLTPLTWDAVNLAEGTITLPVKSGDEHWHPLLPQTVTLLRRLGVGCPGERIFPKWETEESFTFWLRRARKPLRGGILDLRRYAITRMLSLGLDPKTIASITGHRTPALLLNVYARTTEARQGAAIEALQSVAPGNTTFKRPFKRKQR